MLREIIRRPAEILGARFESADIAERVAEGTERQPGKLPLLSDLLHEMWVNMLVKAGRLAVCETNRRKNIALQYQLEGPFIPKERPSKIRG